MSTWFNYTATVKILVFGLLVGALLPALFAVGVRVGAAGAGVSSNAMTQRRPALTALSWMLYALVLTSVVVGVLYIARDFIALHTDWFILGAKPT
jgi:multisubunit Na+/H+ antiporter MnhC subunit